MALYLILSLALVVVGPAIAGLVCRLRVLAYHAFLIFFLHAAGAVLLHVSLQPAAQYAAWGWPLLPLSVGSYAGSALFLLFAGKDLGRPDARVMESFLRRDPSERVIRRARRLLWPLVLFPTAEGDGSTLFTGRRLRRDVRAAAGWAEVYLTNRRVLAQFLSPKIPIIEIALPDVRGVGFADDGAAADLLEIVYADARVGAPTRLAAFTGVPRALPDRVLLNLGRDAGAWLRDLRGALGRGGPALRAASGRTAPESARGEPGGYTPNG
ncbi:MAG TPA: hypothetical protein VFG47_14010 [Geminicoccaceae bacterium]|nr:hypothetical protein [Geminicoccaceae bacterium]